MTPHRIALSLLALGTITALAACDAPLSPGFAGLATLPPNPNVRTIRCNLGGSVEIRGAPTLLSSTVTLTARACRWNGADGVVRLDAPQLVLRRRELPDDAEVFVAGVSGFATYVLNGVTVRCMLDAETYLSTSGPPEMTVTGSPCSRYITRSFAGLE